MSPGASGCPTLGGHIDQGLANVERLRRIFGRHHLFVELQRHLLPDEPALIRSQLDIARQFDLPVVCTNNVHYAHRQSQRLQDVLVSIRHLRSLKEARDLRPNSEYFLKSCAEMQRLWPGQSQALTNTLVIAERCQVSVDFSARRIPDFASPDGHTPFVIFTTCANRDYIEISAGDASSQQAIGLRIGRD